MFFNWLLGMYNLLKCFSLSLIMANDDHPQNLYVGLLSADIFCIAIIFIYIFYVMGLLKYQAYTASRYEYKRHRCYIFLVTGFLLIAVPLYIAEMILWLLKFKAQEGGIIHSEYVYFGSFLAHTIPSMLIILTRPNHDCFTCYNRVEPQRYSCFQYTVDDLLSRTLDTDEE